MRARVSIGDDEGLVVVVMVVVVGCLQEGGRGAASFAARHSTLGNKVCLDEQAHVFAFSIYRNSVRGRS